MVQVICKFPGLILTCKECGVLLHYEKEDIYDGKVYCPICKHANEADLVMVIT